MIEQLPQTDPREQKIRALMNAEVGDNIVTDTDIYKIIEINGDELNLEKKGAKRNGSNLRSVRIEDLVNEMTDTRSELTKQKKEQVSPVFNINNVSPGDFLEMDNGDKLSIDSWSDDGEEITYHRFDPGIPEDGESTMQTRSKDVWSTFQDRVVKFNDEPINKEKEDVQQKSKPKKSKGNNGKGVLNNEVPQDLVSKKRDKSTRWGDTEEEKARPGKKNNADKILDNLDTTPPEDLNLQEVSDWEPGVPEEALETNQTPVEKTKRGRPKKVVETPPAIKQSLEEAGKIMAELEKPKKEVPLNLKRGDVIWNEHNDEIVVLDVVTEPVNEKEALMNGYVLLGFEPKPGRNDEFIEEKVPFSKLEKRKNKIFLTEQIPFVEIDEEAEQEEKTPKFESTAFADLQASLEQEPPPLPAEYLAKVEAEKRLAEGRRLAQLREEISHGDLGADLAKHWTPIDVEIPKREPPLSPSLRKLPKKSWWQRLLGL